MHSIVSRRVHFAAASPYIKPVARPACQRRLRVISCFSADQRQSDSGVSPTGGQTPSGGAAAGAKKYNWTFDTASAGSRGGEGRQVMDLPVAAIRRPLGRTRGNDQAKVEALMESIKEIGLQEPIDVLEVDGVYYGFSGCHRFEAHQRLGAETIRCRVRKANKEVLKMHMM
ncbi:hypothetical protein PLESTB_000112600 [Pleodorina starrii]|uniref:sulfiredoxin n=1 Tax=Pleodorina starrii TaxID=330485 RepID=A0A9W6BAN1_9CHLO|nr:hypothetical protein PLESTM_000108300 [Pleodorina starrii]GLC48573.1 hypothetical protein PLESTB_000112600 [Pleodorina starrii]GLC71894.1 hypothetical protein PLESTF_001178300 [Pleodorina starrii]